MPTRYRDANPVPTSTLADDIATDADGAGLKGVCSSVYMSPTPVYVGVPPKKNRSHDAGFDWSTTRVNPNDVTKQRKDVLFLKTYSA